MRAWKRTLSTGVFTVVAFQLGAASGIRVIDATYGDSQAKEDLQARLIDLQGPHSLRVLGGRWPLRCRRLRQEP